MEEFKPFQVERPWGNFKQFTHNTLSTVKILTVKPEQALSLQSHAKRSEFMRIISGQGILQIGEQKIAVSAGDENFIPVNTKHRITAGPGGLVYLEISLGDFDEADEIRYEDNYGRA